MARRKPGSSTTAISKAPGIHTFARKEDADEYHATIKVNVRQGVRTAPSKT
jgi:hypothetical protein